MTDKSRLFFTYFVGLCLAIAGAVAAPHASMAQQGEPPPLLKKFAADKNATIHKLGQKHGMDGWLIDIDGKQQFAYSSPEGGIIFGVLLSPTGQVETIEQMQTWQGKKQDAEMRGKTLTESSETSTKPSNVSVPPAPVAQEPEKVEKTATGEKSSSRSGIFYNTVEKAHWFAVGKNNAPYIYVFMNPSCVHCLEYWKDLRPYIDSGTIQVRVLPFGSTADNRVPSAALLSSSEPAADWQAYVDGNKDILGADKVTENTAYNKSDSNTAIWTEWRLPATPFTVYRAPESGKIKVLSGRPDNLLLLLSDFIR